MAACASCGAENAEGQRYCGSCGASLSADEERQRQRKTVTVVFCDVVGSTALGESRSGVATVLADHRAPGPRRRGGGRPRSGRPDTPSRRLLGLPWASLTGSPATGFTAGPATRSRSSRCGRRTLAGAGCPVRTGPEQRLAGCPVGPYGGLQVAAALWSRGLRTRRSNGAGVPRF
jgi:hypothetical protein